VPGDNLSLSLNTST